MTDYERALKDPRWQKRRLEILNLADFACEDCHARDKTLEVHHEYYIKAFRLQPWRYPDDLLIALCETCHEFRQGREEALHIALARRLRRLNITEIEGWAWDQIYDEIKNHP